MFFPQAKGLVALGCTRSSESPHPQPACPIGSAGQRSPAFQASWETRTAHSTPFLKILWCGQLCSARNRRKISTETSCALIASGDTIHHSMLCQLRLHFLTILVAISANVINSIPSFWSLFISGFSFKLLRRRGSEDEAWTDRTPCEMKTKRRRELTKRARKRRYESYRWWMTMKNETWWNMGKDFSVLLTFVIRGHPSNLRLRPCP